jgi:hypothetical protein
MTHVASAPTPASDVSLAANRSFVDWPAVFAGAVIAAAMSFVLLTFGTSIGLTLTSPWPNSGHSATFVASIAVFWAMVQQIASFLAGGYVAGRMRPRWSGTAQDEVEFRDGLHGGLVWAVGVVFGAALLMMAAGATARTGVELAGKSVAALSASTSNPMDAVIDTMLRPKAAPAAPENQPPAGAARPAAPQRAASASPTSTDEQRAEITRALAAAAASGSLSGETRAYLAQIVAQRSGLPQAEAEKRVDAAVNSAREAVDKARRGTVLAGLVTAISLVVSFAAAWWAAIQGGQHRDNSVPARFPFSLPRTRPPAAP